MSIGIVGGGAIGLWLASVLSETTEVSLYVRRQEQKREIEQKGIVILGQAPVRRVTLKMTSESWTEDLIILAVKQPALHLLLQEHRLPTFPHQSLLFVQNGMSHLELIKDLSFPNLFVGSVEHGIRKLGDSEIDWKGKGRFRYGVVKGDEAHLTEVINQPAIQAEKVQDWYKMLEDKLVANAVINPLTALYRIENGELLKNPYYLKSAQSLFAEVAQALRMTSEEKHKRWEQIQTICERTATNRSSMLQDLDAGRLTEIEAILGYILRRNEGLSLTVCQFLYDSIKGLERYEKQKV
jgi:2-dehydropantoate 2-reductase